MEKVIYETPEQWGSEVYFFTESALPEYIKYIEICIDGDIGDPIRYDLNKNGNYEGPFYKNHGRDVYAVIDWSDPSNLNVDLLVNGTLR